ncbi:MAG: DUF3592 domain-containing protein [Spirochaetales bacterium]
MVSMFSNTQRTLGMFTRVFRGAALILGLVAVGSALNTLSFVSRAQSAQGEVVDFEQVTNPAPAVNPAGSDSFNHAVVEFETDAGDTSSFNGRSSRAEDTFAVGDSVDVLYRPDSPDVARIDSIVEVWATPLIFGGLFIVFGTLGLIAPFAFSDHRGNRASVSPVWPERPEGDDSSGSGRGDERV